MALLLPPDCKVVSRIELGYNVIKGTEYFGSLYTSVVITEEYNGMVNSEGLIGTAGCLTIGEVSYKPTSLVV